MSPHAGRFNWVMRSIQEIRADLDRATDNRTELWEELGHGLDPAKSAEAARLTGLIEDLWAELRAVKAQQRWGSSELIRRRAMAEERLERDSLRIRKAA
jgi:hypothetical protein